MTKFKSCKKTESIFSNEDFSFEFYESVKNVFIHKNSLVFILSKQLNESQTENVKSHLIEYFKKGQGYKCFFNKEI